MIIYAKDEAVFFKGFNPKAIKLNKESTPYALQY